MFTSLATLSLATSLFATASTALDLDVGSQDSIKSTAKTLAGGIVALYNADVKDTGTPGIFDDPYYWWETGAVFSGLIDYSFLTGDTQYDDLVAEGMLFQLGENEAFMPANQTKSLGTSDQNAWGLAAAAAAENGFSTKKLNGKQWIDYAVNVFNVQALTWDEKTCDGGLRWQFYSFNNGYNYKQATANGDFFLLSARLAKLTGNATYSDWAGKIWNWSKDSGLMSDSFNVYDGFDVTQNCSRPNQIQWSINNAIYVEGAALMYNLTNGQDTWKTPLTSLLNITTSKIFSPSSILTETACEMNSKCSTDIKAYKGLAAISLARAATAAPFTKDQVSPILTASAKGAASGCSGQDDSLQCKFQWNGKGDAESVTDGGLGEAFGALAVVQGLLVPKAGVSAGGSNTTEAQKGNGTTGAAPSPSGSGAPAKSGDAKPVEGSGGAGVAGVSRFLGAAVSVALVMVWL